jgi:hypothetical protein
MQRFRRTWSEADINWQMKPADSVRNDPNRTSAESRASFHQEFVRPATNATILAETEIVR